MSQRTPIGAQKRTRRSEGTCARPRRNQREFFEMKPGRKLEFRKAFLSLGEKLHEFSQVIDPGEEATGRVRALYSGGTGPYAEAATEERVELLIATSNEGDVEIVNPTPEQVEQLLAGHAPQAPSG